MNFPHRFRRPPASLLPVLAILALLSFSATPRAQEPPATKALPPSATVPADWENLFDGKTLAGWKPSAFTSQREVKVENPFRDGRSAIVLEKSDYLSGLTWAGAADPPTLNYEVALEAMKLDGGDFFCGLTFPVGKTACSFIVGGWGGMVVGISSVDGDDASENETTDAMTFERNRWYRIRVRVTPEKIEAWIDQRQVVDLATVGHKISLRFGDIDNSLPLGIAAYQTRAALRDIRLRRL